MFASVQPSQEPLLDQVSQFMTPPSDQICSSTRFAKKRKVKFESSINKLDQDSLDLVLHPLVLNYINTPAIVAHHNWTLLRSVSRAFQISVDAATCNWVLQASNLVKACQDRLVCTALRLRAFVVPTGLDVLQLAMEASLLTTGRHIKQRDLLLIYMRLRSRKALHLLPPDPPKTLSPEEVKHTKEFGPRMSFTHGQLLAQDSSVSRRYNTRQTDQQISLVVRLFSRVPHHLVNYAKVCGWEL
jgi:hypothetical protein